MREFYISIYSLEEIGIILEPLFSLPKFQPVPMITVEISKQEMLKALLKPHKDRSLSDIYNIHLLKFKNASKRSPKS